MRFSSLRAKPAVLFLTSFAAVLLFLTATWAQNSSNSKPSAAAEGQGAPDNWQNERPGDRFMVKASELPMPYSSDSASNHTKIVPRPENAWPLVPEGFKIDMAATGLQNPRNIVTAPNGDLFFAETAPGRVLVIRGFGPDGKAQTPEEFASGLMRPYGIAFYPPGPNPKYVYVANTESVVRFPYKNGDLKATGPAETVVATLPPGGHFTRNIVFSKDGKKLYVAVGSKANVGDSPDETDRADVLEYNPDGTGHRVYTYGTRNPTGITVNPKTGQLWICVNERDELGDDLPPDYVTHIVDGGFFGWPWYYIGTHPDPRMAEKHPELKEKVIVPDVLLQSHSAPLSLTFYNGRQFPAEYRGDLFVASHGSWNRADPTGYGILRLYTPNGKATGEYQDFVTGFVVTDQTVWGRPVGVTVASDGSLVFTDDGSNSVWRVTYVGNKRSAK